MAETAFGKARLVEAVTLRQAAGDKRFSTRVELLLTDDGESVVRVAYSTDGVARRGPVTFRAEDVRRLARALARAPRLRAVLEENVAGVER